MLTYWMYLTGIKYYDRKFLFSISLHIEVRLISIDYYRCLLLSTATMVLWLPKQS